MNETEESKDASETSFAAPRRTEAGSGDVYVADTSIIIEKKVSELILKGEIAGRLVIPIAVIAELEHQANFNQAEGFLGLEEIKTLQAMAKEGKIKFEFHGARPTVERIKGARVGEMDDLIRETAVKLKATLITGDRVQATVAEALGVKTILILPVSAKEVGALEIEKYFDAETMSVHLKEETTPTAKCGRPGNWQFTQLSETPLTQHDVKTFAADVTEKTKLAAGSFIEYTNAGMTILQFKNFRVVIARPPFSDGWEITAVRPVATLEIEDYKLNAKLLQRLKDSATGILISGSPGSGKTTFASALAKAYVKLNKIVKTIESPRDLQVPPEVVQYSKNLGNRDDIHNVMLLTRPDYTIFDEMRITEDFRLYADLRLAGIGLAGVIHATNPIDSVQRFIGRVELGMIPQIIDTVVFIRDGKVEKVFEMAMKVKVPTGMVEADLSRPVVEVRDFETQELDYEIYTYGEQTVVVPMKKKKSVQTERGGPVSFKFREANKFVSVYLPASARSVKMLISGREVATLQVPRTGELRIHKKSKLGKMILGAADGGELSFI